MSKTKYAKPSIQVLDVNLKRALGIGYLQMSDGGDDDGAN